MCDVTRSTPQSACLLLFDLTSSRFPVPQLYNARVDPPAAWLSFRMLLALVANIASTLRGRPISTSPVTNVSGGIGSIPTSATRPSGAATPKRKLSSLPLLLQPGWRATSASSPRMSVSGLQSTAPPPLNPQNNLGLMGTSLQAASGAPSSLLMVLTGAASISNESSFGSRSRPGSSAGGLIHSPSYSPPKRSTHPPALPVAGMASWHKHHQTVHHQHPPQAPMLLQLHQNRHQDSSGSVRSGDGRGGLSEVFSVGSGRSGRGTDSALQMLSTSKPALLAHAISEVQQGVGFAQAVVIQPRHHASLLGASTAAFTAASLAAAAAAASAVVSARRQPHAVQFSLP